jgi:hypothetical protein
MLEDVMNNILRSPDVVAASMQVTINQLLEKGDSGATVSFCVCFCRVQL